MDLKVGVNYGGGGKQLKKGDSQLKVGRVITAAIFFLKSGLSIDCEKGGVVRVESMGEVRDCGRPSSSP